MGGFEVEIDALRSAAVAAERAGEQVGAIDLAGAIAGVRAALPGSRSGSLVAGVADTWRWQINSSSRAAAEFGHDMAAAAHRYLANDEEAARDLSALQSGRPSR